MKNKKNTHIPSVYTRRTFLATIATTAGAIALAACNIKNEKKSGKDPEVRKITPPRLDTAYLGQQILCYRPMRRGSPNMSIETIGDKIIAHNYGHGGSGWTLGPGSAKYVVDLAEASSNAKSTSRTAPVNVIGAGVMGLFTAYELTLRGYTNITVVASSFDGLTSHNAGGLLAPVSMDNNPSMQPVIDRIGIDAYRFYSDVATGKQPHFSSGALIMPAYFENRSESGLEPYVGKVMQSAKDVVLDFGNGTKRNMVSYDDGIFMDTAIMMQSLNDYLKDKVKFEQRKVERYSDLSSSLIFDCSGLGAGSLNGDKDMVSVQGHLIMLRDQVPAHLQSMILVYFPKGKTTSGQEVKRSFYIFPKQLPGSAVNDIGVVGGTFIEGATPETPNMEEFDLLVSNARKFYGI
ncbi:MAG: D-amino acid dehydrogenase [Bacteroidota bacterium]|jgi:D-amino-acid oxidase